MLAIEGRDVREVSHGWLVLRAVRVPWHRIQRIELDGEVVWERRS